MITRGSTTCNIFVRPRGCLIYRVIISSLQISIPDLSFSHLSFFFYLVIYKFPSLIFVFPNYIYFFTTFSIQKEIRSLRFYIQCAWIIDFEMGAKIIVLNAIQMKYLFFHFFFYKHDWLNLIDYLTHSSLGHGTRICIHTCTKILDFLMNPLAIFLISMNLHNTCGHDAMY